VLARKPAIFADWSDGRWVRNTAFDMVQRRSGLQVMDSSEKPLLIGRMIQLRTNTKQSIENLRPRHIYDSLLLRSIYPDKVIALL